MVLISHLAILLIVLLGESQERQQEFIDAEERVSRLGLLSGDSRSILGDQFAIELSAFDRAIWAQVVVTTMIVTTARLLAL